LSNLQKFFHGRLPTLPIVTGPLRISRPVIPAEAGIQDFLLKDITWIPVFTGMTQEGSFTWITEGF
jgi:hypothetical protein